MITVKRASREKRQRDRRRQRLILIVGNRSYHITADEGLMIARRILNALQYQNAVISVGDLKAVGDKKKGRG